MEPTYLHGEAKPRTTDSIVIWSGDIESAADRRLINGNLINKDSEIQKAPDLGEDWFRITLKFQFVGGGHQTVQIERFVPLLTSASWWKKPDETTDQFHIFVELKKKFNEIQFKWSVLYATPIATSDEVARNPGLDDPNVIQIADSEFSALDTAHMRSLDRNAADMTRIAVRSASRYVLESLDRGIDLQDVESDFGSMAQPRYVEALKRTDFQAAILIRAAAVARNKNAAWPIKEICTIMEIMYSAD